MKDWKSTKLGDVATFINGYPFKPTQWSDSGKEIIRIQNLTKGSAQINYFEGQINEKYNVTKGDLLISWSGTLGIYEWDNEDGWLNQHIFKVVFDKEDIDKKFFSFLIQTLLVQMNSQVHGATMKHITKKKFDDLQIPLPPLAEQKRIAAILDAANLHRQKTNQLITKYNDLSQSLFLDMFGDPVTNPKGWEKENFEFFASFDTKMTSDFEKYSEYPHIGIGNIEKDSGKISGYNLVKDEDLKSGKYIFSPNHIIYSKIRPNLNKVALPDFNGLCSADSYPLLVNLKNTNRLFFASLLRSNDFLEFILGHSTRTNIPKANKSQMRLYEGIAPPVESQNKFAAQIQEIEKQKSQAEASLQRAEDLFQSLLQKAFKGEL